MESKPSLREIRDCIFEATKRYVRLYPKLENNSKDLSKVASSKKDSKMTKEISSTSMAINIKPNSKSKSVCMLCKLDDKV